MMHAEQIGDANASGKNHGTLKSDGKEYSVFVFSDSEAVTEAVAKFLQDANQQEQPTEQLSDFEFIHIDQEMIEVETEIGEIFKDLSKTETPKEASKLSHLHENQTESKLKSPEKTEPRRPFEKGQSSLNSQSNGRSDIVYSSLFSLARTFHTTLSESRQKNEILQEQTESSQVQKEGRSTIFLHSRSNNIEEKLSENRYDREGNGKQEKGKDDEEKERFSQNQEQKQNQGKSSQTNKKKKTVSISHVQTARGAIHKQAANPNDAQARPNNSGHSPLGSIENIYIRFMALMARILGQAELEAHQLYLRIKERTDAIDALTLLISKINSEKGAIDWSNNEEMKKLIDKARALGVDIPEGKYQWSEEEKKLLKENIQMRKDSMEKMTQLERTDMQRYLQEASQCHQARSNVLKVLKEVIDTFIHNMRPS